MDHEHPNGRSCNQKCPRKPCQVGYRCRNAKRHEAVCKYHSCPYAKNGCNFAGTLDQYKAHIVCPFRVAAKAAVAKAVVANPAATNQAVASGSGAAGIVAQVVERGKVAALEPDRPAGARPPVSSPDFKRLGKHTYYPFIKKWGVYQGLVNQFKLARRRFDVATQRCIRVTREHLDSKDTRPFVLRPFVAIILDTIKRRQKGLLEPLHDKDDEELTSDAGQALLKIFTAETEFFALSMHKLANHLSDYSRSFSGLAGDGRRWDDSIESIRIDPKADDDDDLGTYLGLRTFVGELLENLTDLGFTEAEATREQRTLKGHWDTASKDEDCLDVVAKRLFDTATKKLSEPIESSPIESSPIESESEEEESSEVESEVASSRSQSVAVKSEAEASSLEDEDEEEDEDEDVVPKEEEESDDDEDGSSSYDEDEDDDDDDDNDLYNLATGSGKCECGTCYLAESSDQEEEEEDVKPAIPSHPDLQFADVPALVKKVRERISEARENEPCSSEQKENVGDGSSSVQRGQSSVATKKSVPASDTTGLTLASDSPRNVFGTQMLEASVNANSSAAADNSTSSSSSGIGDTTADTSLDTLATAFVRRLVDSTLKGDETIESGHPAKANLTRLFTDAKAARTLPIIPSKKRRATSGDSSEGEHTFGGKRRRTDSY